MEGPLVFRREPAQPPLVLLVGVLLYTISVYTNLGSRIDFLATIRHELLAGSVLSILAIWALMTYKISSDNYWVLLVGTLSLVGVEISQVPFAVSPSHAWLIFFNFTIKLIFFGIFLAAFVRTPRDLRWFMGAFFFSLFWVYQESVHGLITGNLLWWNQGIMRLHGSVPLYRQPNGLSLIAVTGLPFVIALFPVVRSKLLRLFFLLLAAMIIPLIVYTGSRAGYVGTLGLCLAWWVSSRHKVRGLLFGVVIVLCTVQFIPEEYAGRFESISGDEVAGHSREARLQIMEDAWAIFCDNPLGVGVDGFRSVRFERFGRDQYTHNLYLQIATHLGIQGFLIFLFFIGTVFWTYAEAMRRLTRLNKQVGKLVRRRDIGKEHKLRLEKLYNDVRFSHAVARGCTLYLFMVVINGMFNHSLYTICWWFASGLAFALLTMTASLERMCPISVPETKRPL